MSYFLTLRLSRVTTPALGLCLLLLTHKSPAQEGTKLSWETELELGAVGGAHFERRADIGSVDAANLELRTVASAQVRDGLLVRFGFALGRDSFGLPNGAPLPHRLQSATLVIGGDFQAGPAWLFRLEVQPGFYSGEDTFRGRDFNAPVIFGGSYFVSADLALVAGLSVDINRKYPVLGAVGLRWKFAEKWVLDAILPTPRLEYNVSKSLTLFAGADFRGDTYRVGDRFGRSRGVSNLDNAVVDYFQIRAGAGASWKISSSVALEFEAGCVPIWDFNFHRAEVGVTSTDIPPYAGLSLKAAF